MAGSPQVPTKVDTALLSGKWSHHLGPSSDPGRGRAGTGRPARTSIGLRTPGAHTPVPAQPRGVLSDHSASPGSQKSQVSPGPCTCRRREPRPPRPPLSKHPDRMSLLIPGEPAATCLQGRLLGSRVRASALTAWKCQRQAWPDPASTLCNSKASWEVTPQEGGSHHGHCARTAPRQGLRRPPVQTPPAFHARGRVVNRCSERGNFLMDQQPSKKKTPRALQPHRKAAEPPTRGLRQCRQDRVIASAFQKTPRVPAPLPLSPFSPPDRDRRGDSPAWSGRGSRPSRRTSG